MDKVQNNLSQSQTQVEDTENKLLIKQGFDRELKQLIKQSQETILSRYGSLIEMGEIRVELVCLEKYSNLYKKMKPEEHYCYFETFYNRHRFSILNCLKDDKWIRNGKLVIQFGDGIKEFAGKCESIRIMLSDIYLIACDLQVTAEKALDGIDEKFSSGAGGKDLIRPNIILVHLLRIFYYINDGSDKTQLGEIVSKLEDELGIPPERKTIIKSNLQNTRNNEPGEEGLSSLFTMATGMMERMGFQPPQGIKTPSNKEISEVINKVFNNDATQVAIQKMFTSLQECTDLSSAVQTVVKNVTDPATMGAIQDSVVQTAQIASQLPPSQNNQSHPS